MAHKNFLFTSESVSEGHPDKVCDQISDAVLDAFLENDIKLGIADDSAINTRLGCETLTTTNKIIIAGEGRGQEPFFRKYDGKTVVDREMLAHIARGVVKDARFHEALLRSRARLVYDAAAEVMEGHSSPDVPGGEVVVTGDEPHGDAEVGQGADRLGGPTLGGSAKMSRPRRVTTAAMSATVPDCMCDRTWQMRPTQSTVP